MSGFKDLSIVVEQRISDPPNPAANRVSIFQLNDGSTNVLFPNGDKKRLDNTLVEAAIASISAGLSTVYHGVQDCVANQVVYTITHPTVNVLTDVPVVSLIVPNANSSLSVQGTFNRTSTSFDVVLSDMPDSSNFKISWIIISSGAVSSTNDANYVHKTGNESISGVKTFISDLIINGKLTVDGLIDPTGLELVPQTINPGIVAANTLWLNSNDSDKLYIGIQPVGTGSGSVSGIGNWATISTTITSQNINTPTQVNTNAALYTAHDVSLQGYGIVNTPTNMQNGQSINVLMTQDLTPYKWDIEYSVDFEFPLGVPVVPSSGAESTTVVTVLKVRNRYFATGLVEFF